MSGGARAVDGGLRGLGLLMQLGGDLFIGLAAFYAFLTVMTGAGPMTFWLFAIFATSAIRSAMHRSAGSALVHGTVTALPRVRSYVIVAVVQTAAVLVLLGRLGLGALRLPIGALLLAWPTAIGVVSSAPRLRALLADPIREADDAGYEGL